MSENERNERGGERERDRGPKMAENAQGMFLFLSNQYYLGGKI